VLVAVVLAQTVVAVVVVVEVLETVEALGKMVVTLVEVRVLAVVELVVQTYFLVDLAVLELLFFPFLQ
jgi:hypothetical protein